ncbi:polyribonucleotide nucleotidyltransferase [Thermoclostridium stercorarium subsp. thermolacticum DSM 2910]|uniref:Polyribonucleotide nucleotidyltransferase n=2 Tax=Thermoclostridium stercorarium TaxID=1510 RepID=A0A1B1YPM8_THEST|nr:polyribonucleotide nucleotidyltransferase [Thermoclostridium stercorarium]ANX00056.1 polyribonucleotide nucleotidyltransferase [Thermoclostridium stercorarium subsp. thermolacticum DSM 2910]ANX02699.1 polyribonucleotide nucleotidyltransferase [Thermoclostridium stercorarium subsp. leptospartum DSM 9219]UZQ85138.1 polyribonucleotide nucleotidyltransferase [Thermoclostridium stercorarium]
MKREFSIDVAGRKLTVEVGQLAQFANGSALVRYGDTVVLSTATMAPEPREGIDFFPLNVDYEEKLYSVGKIPGGFIKREGKPSDSAILTARVIDRQIRPRFPKDLRNDVSVVNMVLSVEQDNSPEFAAIIGTIVSLCISDIPFNGPIAGVILGLVDGEVVINPTLEQRKKSRMYVTLSADWEKIVMIEAGANEVPEDVMMQAIRKGHEEIRRLIDFIDGIVKEVGKEKITYVSMAVPQEIYDEVESLCKEELTNALMTADKAEREKNVEEISKKVHETLDEKYPEAVTQISDALYKLQRKIVRDKLLHEKKRVDGRGLMDIRPLHAEVGILPRTHGSALFQRGHTQVLTNVTLGPLGDVQLLDGVDVEETKRYMHHYNFPGFSVGEAKPARGPGRREIGHGALAERALEPVIPPESEFPYAIRLVSEVLMSNGSTSQASVCGSTLALMDAGVPIREPVAGISAGLVVDEENPDNFITFIDIQGIEDFFGDMDFKVAGTKNGITAIQVDIKVDGLTYEMVEQAFEITRQGRLKILNDVILKVIDKPRDHLSPYAPKVFTTTIDIDKIREVIGPGGKVIQRIIADTGVKIDIEDDGKVYVSTSDEEAGKRAIEMIEGIAGEVKIGQQFTGKVTRIMNFGALVEFLPGKEGMVHISKLSNRRVRKVEDVVKVGDRIPVKVIAIDKQGRVNLSMKDCK